MKNIYYNRILQLRNEANVSQRELANFLELNRSSFSHYELGNRNLTMSTLKKLSMYFDVSIDYIVYKDDYKNHHDFIKEVLGLEDESIKILTSHKQTKEINKYIQSLKKEVK